MLMFPLALVSCIADARAPSIKELATMTQRVWRDVYRGAGSDGDYYRSVALARLALAGTEG
jgi:hypothetical protein